MVSIPHDYHMHSEFSIDCDVSIVTRCETAIELGLAEICVTDHADFVPKSRSNGYYRPDAYFAEVERCRAVFGDRVTLRAGVEIGEWHIYPERATALAEGYPYDFILGSLHRVGEETVMLPDYFHPRSELEAYEAYYTELLVMIQHGGFDVMAHLDVPKRYGFTVHNRYVSGEYEAMIREVLRAAIAGGIGLEINTGTARRTVGEPSPDLGVLRWYRELGGEIITVGSDAHRTADVAYGFDQAAEMLREVGFRAIAGYQERTPFFVDL